MIRGIKRPIQSYLFQVLWIAMVLYFSTKDSSQVAKWFFWTAALFGLISLGHMIWRSNYIEVRDNKLVINEGIFNRRLIALDKIEKFDIEPSPFTASKIVMKDQSLIRYSDSQTSEKKLKEFMAQFNIPVE